MPNSSAAPISLIYHLMEKFDKFAYNQKVILHLIFPPLNIGLEKEKVGLSWSFIFLLSIKGTRAIYTQKQRGEKHRKKGEPRGWCEGFFLFYLGRSWLDYVSLVYLWKIEHIQLAVTRDTFSWWWFKMLPGFFPSKCEYLSIHTRMYM